LNSGMWMIISFIIQCFHPVLSELNLNHADRLLRFVSQTKK
jgi:hypothetical protein